MKIFALGKSLEEVILDSGIEAANEEGSRNCEDTEKDSRSKSDGRVFVGCSRELEELTENAALLYDGEIDIRSIGFCKIESQQECLAGTLCIPRLSDVCGSKYKILFFVNKKNIVIVDDSGFSLKLIRRIQINRTKQGQTRERFLYN